MKVLGVELSRESPPTGPAEKTLVLLQDDGAVAHVQRADTLPAVAAAVGQLVGEEPFLLGIDIPVVVPDKSARARPVENLIRRRFGVRLRPGGRAALSAEPLGVAGEALIAGLAAAGLPCLPYPDRNRRQSGLAETRPELVLKSLLWESSTIATAHDQRGREELFRAYNAPHYRAARLSARATWAEQAVALELVLRALGDVDGFDFEPVKTALADADTSRAVERAGAMLDAVLIAGTSRRYLDSPENCLFMGDQSAGYVILPADGFVRRLALADSRTQHGELFPQASLRERLGADARLAAHDLLTVPGRPHRIDATFSKPPHYEFDNLDEMLWWKHCRHLSGPRLPTEGLCELIVNLGPRTKEEPSSSTSLRLVRSRHRTLSFRFDPPTAWRTRLPTRDGRTYPMRILRAVYETAEPE